MRHFVPDVGRRFVLAESLIDDLPQKIVAGPGEILDLGDQLGPHPMDTAENQWICRHTVWIRLEITQQRVTGRHCTA